MKWEKFGGWEVSDFGRESFSLSTSTLGKEFHHWFLLQTKSRLESRLFPGRFSHKNIAFLRSLGGCTRAHGTRQSRPRASGFQPRDPYDLCHWRGWETADLRRSQLFSAMKLQSKSVFGILLCSSLSSRCEYIIQWSPLCRQNEELIQPLLA